MAGPKKAKSDLPPGAVVIDNFEDDGQWEEPDLPEGAKVLDVSADDVEWEDPAAKTVQNPEPSVVDKFKSLVQPEEPSVPTGLAAAAGAAQGVNLGLSDEISGAFGSGVEGAQRIAQGAAKPYQSPLTAATMASTPITSAVPAIMALYDYFSSGDAKKAYESDRDTARENLGVAQEEHPFAYTAGDIAASAATSFLPMGAAGAGIKGVRAANAAAKAAETASAASKIKALAAPTLGALGRATAEGGVRGFGESEGGVEDQALGTLAGAGTGLLTAGITRKAVTPKMLAFKGAKAMLGKTGLGAVAGGLDAITEVGSRAFSSAIGRPAAGFVANKASKFSKDNLNMTFVSDFADKIGGMKSKGADLVRGAYVGNPKDALVLHEVMMAHDPEYKAEYQKSLNE